MFTDPQINYHVKDAEVAARFYRESFGFTETFRTPDHGPPVHIEMRLGGLTLGFATFDSLREVHGITAGSGPPRAEVVVRGPDRPGRARAERAARLSGFAARRLGRRPGRQPGADRHATAARERLTT